MNGASFITYLCIAHKVKEREGQTDQTNSLHTEQKVGCLKKVAMNSWFFMKWILACLIAPRLRFRVGASSSFAACLPSVRKTEKYRPFFTQYCNRKKLSTVYKSHLINFNDYRLGSVRVAVVVD